MGVDLGDGSHGFVLIRVRDLGIVHGAPREVSEHVPVNTPSCLEKDVIRSTAHEHCEQLQLLSTSVSSSESGNVVI